MIGLSILWAFLVLFLKKLAAMNPYFLVLNSASPEEQAMEPAQFNTQTAEVELGFSLLQGGFWVLAFSPFLVGCLLVPTSTRELSLCILTLLVAHTFSHYWVAKVTRNGPASLRKFLFRLHQKLRRILRFVLGMEALLQKFILSKETWDNQVRTFQESILRSSQRESQKEEERGLEVEEREILRQLDGLFHTGVQSVMTPVSRVISVPNSWTIKQTLDHSSLHGYSRYPVVKEDGTVVGIFRANQLSLAREEDLPVTERMDDEVRLRADMSCYEALEEMKVRKVQAANVYDSETWVGLVSIEDLLEEFVGEIEDEFDESDLRKTSEDGFLVNASIAIQKLQDYFSEPFKNTRSRTLNGFLLTRFGKVPPKYSSLTLETIRITVLESDGSKVQKVRIQRLRKVS